LNRLCSMTSTPMANSNWTVSLNSGLTTVLASWPDLCLILTCVLLQTEKIGEEFVRLRKEMNTKCEELKTESLQRRQLEVEMGTVCQLLDNRTAELSEMRGNYLLWATGREI